jgi:carboxylate-amine ligase
MRTVGIEEEFLLVSRRSARLVSDGDRVVAAAELGSDGQFEHELCQEQAELATTPHRLLGALGDELRRRRAELSAGAERRGVRLAAMATSPLTQAVTTTRGRRYEQMVSTFGQLAAGHLACGLHVHVSVSSPDEGVGVLDRIQPWLPVLIALSANSPFYEGLDTGYASYRTILCGRWPTAGMTEPFGDLAGYRQLTEGLVASGAAMDDAMIYFPARLSSRYPTVEVRVADVCPYADDAVTIAALVRALVETEAAAWAAGRDPASARTELLRAANWRAARFGMEGDLVDASSGRLVRAWNQVASLMCHVAAALAESGDTELVESGLAEIGRRGTGARTQRDALARGGTVGSVVQTIVDCTLAQSRLNAGAAGTRSPMTNRPSASAERAKGEDQCPASQRT